MFSRDDVSVSLRARMRASVCLSVCLLLTFAKGSAVTGLREMIVSIYVFLHILCEFENIITRPHFPKLS